MHSFCFNQLMMDCCLTHNRKMKLSMVEEEKYGFLILPQFSLLLLGRNFDHTRLVDDSRRPLTLFDNTNDPSLITLLFFDVLEREEVRDL